MLICIALLDTSSLGFVLSTSTSEDWTVNSMARCDYVLLDRRGHRRFHHWFWQPFRMVLWHSLSQIAVRFTHASPQLQVNWEAMCATLGSARQLEWFWELNLLVFCSRRNLAAGYVYLMTDLWFLLIWWGKWSPVNNKAIKNCFFFVMIGFPCCCSIIFFQITVG